MVQTGDRRRTPMRAPSPPADPVTGVMRLRRPTPERWALLVLVVVPLLVFVIPALVGHTVDPGDDLTQNFPLRILVGQQLRAGHLPLFDPYIWSGAPLLAGWNAGAAYPLTWLYAVLPGAVAWTMGLVFTWWVASIGLFAFLRALRLSVLASLLGALTFTLAGAMTPQVTHFGLVAGASWVPLQLLAVLRITDKGGRPASVVGWCVVLAAAVGLTFLAGEPRAVDVAAAAVVPYALWRLVRLGRHALVPAVAVAGGGLLGMALGAVQLLPGVAAVATSQRAGGGVQLYSSGSIPVRWLLLFLVPNLMGGSGSFGQPAFFGPYNLTEITAYAGLLPVVGAFGLLGRLRFHRPLPDWLVWHVVAALGVLLALGTHTPAWHLFAAVPLSGAERLPSRDLMVVDLALAVLFAYWVDGWLVARRRAGPGERRRVDRSTITAVLPALGALATVVLALVWGAGFLGWLGLDRSAAALDGGLKPWLVPWLVLATLATVLVLTGPRLEIRSRRRLLVAFCVGDAVVYSLLVVVAVAPGLGHGPPAVSAASVPATSAGSGSSPAPAGTSSDTTPYPLSRVVGTGRFAVYDPGLRDSAQLTVLGAPDGNVVSGFASVQGYGSIENATYAATTGTHLASGGGQNVLSPGALADGTFDQLELTVLAVPGPYLMTPPAGQAGAGSVQPGPTGTGRRHLVAGQRTVWYLGPPVAVSSVSVPLDSGPSGGTALGLEQPDGQVRWLTTGVVPGARVVQAHAGRPVTAVALVARAGRAAVDLGVPTVSYSGESAQGAPELLSAQVDGQLADALTSPRWRYAGIDGDFALYRDTDSQPALSLEGLHGGPAVGASVRALSGPSFAPSSAAVSSPAGVEVVRSEAAVPGWTALWRSAGGGPPRALSIRRHGLVQAVVVPPGAGVVSWSYDAPWFWPALTISAAALALLGLLVAVMLRLRRRARAGSSGIAAG